MYATGQVDEVKGTGVWKDFQLKRETEEEVRMVKDAKEDGKETEPETLPTRR